MPKVDRLLTGLTAQQKGTTARWYSNKASLFVIYKNHSDMFPLWWHVSISSLPARSNETNKSSSGDASSLASCP